MSYRPIKSGTHTRSGASIFHRFCVFHAVFAFFQEENRAVLHGKSQLGAFQMREIVLRRGKLFCRAENCFAAREIVLRRGTLFCGAGNCFAAWEIILRRDKLFFGAGICFIARKIVLRRGKLFCDAENCFATRDIAREDFENRMNLLFCSENDLRKASMGGIFNRAVQTN